MIKGLHHPGLVVPDMDGACRFYEKMFGFTVLYRNRWEAPSLVHDRVLGLENCAGEVALLQGVNCFLEVFCYDAPESDHVPGLLQANDQGIRHLAFEVDDVHAQYRRFLELGGTALSEPVSIPGGGSAVYCRDPFGTLIELTTATGRMPPLADISA